MKRKTISKILIACCNIGLLSTSIILGGYSFLNTHKAETESRKIYTATKKQYEEVLQKTYQDNQSYLDDIVVMKLEIANEIIQSAKEYKNDYFKTNSTDKEAKNQLQDSLESLNVLNKSIEINTSSLPYVMSCNSLYDSLSYISVGLNSYLVDIFSFVDDTDCQYVATMKDIQHINVLAKTCYSQLTAVKRIGNLYTIILPIISVIIFLGTVFNIYVIRRKRRKYRKTKYELPHTRNEDTKKHQLLS